MNLTLQYRFYERPFATPLVTRYGTWTTRHGIIIRLEDETGRVGFGEVAPLSEFSKHSLAEAKAQLDAFPRVITSQTIFNRSDTHSPLQFALESAQLQLTHWPELESRKKTLSNTALLPAGESGLKQMDALLEAGYTTFKWKIGTAGLKEEQSLALHMLKRLSDQGRLRLDANGSLTEKETEQWLDFVEQTSIDFLEQPLPVGREKEMASLAKKYTTAIALDESVSTPANLNALCHLFPQGPFVIKTALIGSIRAFIKWRRAHAAIRLIYSSSFETSIGFQAGLLIAATDKHSSDSVGFGTLAYFKKDVFNAHNSAPILETEPLLRSTDFDPIWNSLS